MKYFIQSSLSLIFFICSITYLHGQDTIPQSNHLKKSNSILAYSPIHLSSLYFEHFYKDQRSFAIEAGYVQHRFNSYSLIPFLIYNAAVLKLYLLKYRSTNFSKVYFQGFNFVGKYQWNDEIRYDPGKFGGTCESTAYDQSMKAQTFVLRYMFGHKKYYNSLVIDTYVGIGAMVQFRQRHVYLSGRACDDYSTWTTERNENESDVIAAPSILIGIRFGLTWGK